MVQSYYNVLAAIEAATLAAGTTIDKQPIVGGTTTLVVESDATLTVTQASHANRIVLLQRSGTQTVTLPNAAGNGTTYTFISLSGLLTRIINVGRAADIYYGVAILGATGTVSLFKPGIADNTLTLNGSTTGGALGQDWISMTDIGTNAWFVRAVLWGSGTLATPYSQGVT